MNLLLSKLFTGISLYPVFATVVYSSPDEAVGDIEKLLNNANIPALCLIIGVAVIIFSYFARKSSAGQNDNDGYNEKSYSDFHTDSHKNKYDE